MNKKELKDLICEIYEIDQVSQLIENQISKFVKQHGYSYKDIGRAFYYYAIILEREIKLDGGIGIVPYYMEPAQKWFKAEKERLAKLERQGREAKKAAQETKDIIKIKEVKRERRGIVKIDIENI